MLDEGHNLLLDMTIQEMYLFLSITLQMGHNERFLVHTTTVLEPFMEK
jgi:hypothetical protein